MAHPHSFPPVALLFALVLAPSPAFAQLKLPKHPPEKGSERPRGEVTPHMDCVVCGTRSYTAHVDGRKDERGRDLVWCEACKRDTPHTSNVNTSPGLGGGAEREDGDLKLPRARPPESAVPAEPAPPPAADAPPPPSPQGPRLPASFVFDDLKLAKNARDPLLTSAVDSLIAAGEAGLSAARAELPTSDPWRLLVAARCLARVGTESDQDLLRARVGGKVPSAVATELVEELAARDPVRSGPAWLAGLLEHGQGYVRQAAQRVLARTSGPEMLPHLERALGDKRADTRLAAIELAAGVVDARATEMLVAHLDDPSSRVAATVLKALGLREDAGLDARLLAIAFRDRWVLRRGAYAIAAIVEREDVRLQPILDRSHVEPLLETLDKQDAFLSAVAATALSGIGFQSTDPRTSTWLDRPVMDRLVMAVSGQEFHDDLSAIVPGALRRLRLLSGQTIATDGPRWIDWWIGAREGFEARRAALALAPADVPGALVRFESTATEPEAFTIVGPESAAGAQSRISAGEIFYANLAEMTDLIATFQREGLFGAEILPGPRGARGRGDRTLEVVLGARAKSFTLGPNVKETWFERAVLALHAVRERNRWQRFPSARSGQDALALWQQESAWWQAEHSETERDLRLKSLVLASMSGASSAQRELGIAELERLVARPDGARGEDFQALLALLSEETTQGDHAARLARLALASGRKLGTDGYVPDESALALAGVYTKLFGQNAVDALAEQFQAARREFVRAIAADERPILRAVAAKTLAVDPSQEDIATLIRLLADRDLSVETAAVAALGAHKIEEARTELLVRARVGFPAVRAAALEAIGRMGGEYVLEALIQAINDKDHGVRIAATKGLAALGDPAAAQVLISALAEVGDTDVFDAARAGLVSMGERAWPDLIRVVNQPAGRIRREAALILSEAGRADAVSPLLSILTANPKDARVANELCVITCIDMRAQTDPAQAWWGWWDGVRHDDASVWFRAALERVGVAPPAPGALEGSGTVQGRTFLVSVMGRSESWLVERARREFARQSGRDPGLLPPPGPDRDAWLRTLRESTSQE